MLKELLQNFLDQDKGRIREVEVLSSLSKGSKLRNGGITTTI